MEQKQYSWNISFEDIPGRPNVAFKWVSLCPSVTDHGFHGTAYSWKHGDLKVISNF